VIVPNPKIKVTFIIPKADVVTGFVFFDEGFFQEECLGFIRGNDGFYISTFFQKEMHRRSYLSFVVEIGANSLTKVRGFPYIQNFFLLRAKQVNAR